MRKFMVIAYYLHNDEKVGFEIRFSDEENEVLGYPMDRAEKFFRAHSCLNAIYEDGVIYTSDELVNKHLNDIEYAEYLRICNENREYTI